MYIIYTKNGKYASAAVSKRTGKKTSVTYTYLGTVIDKEKGIYQNSQRGVFTFDPKTNSYGTVPESFVPPRSKDRRKHERLILDFGDAFFTNAFLHQSGLVEVIDTIDCRDPDTMHAMLLFYMISGLSNCSAQVWYEGSIAKLLFPKANLSVRNINDFLQSLGNSEKQLRFQKAYTDFVLKYYSPDKTILIDPDAFTGIMCEAPDSPECKENFTKLFPLHPQTKVIFQGHLLLSYIASCAFKIMQLKLKSTDILLESRLACMRNQKCTVCEENIVIGYPQKLADDTYKAFHITAPDSLPLKEGILQYVPPKAGLKTSDNPSAREPEAKRGRGRPKGSKNKATLEKERLLAEAIAKGTAAAPVKRGRGRPKGSKNKK